MSTTGRRVSRSLRLLLLTCLASASWACVAEVGGEDGADAPAVQDVDRTVSTTKVAARTPAELADEATLLSLHNAARKAAGLPRLMLHFDLTDDARFHADRMADGSYCTPAGSICHSKDLATFVASGWQRLGENVGLGYSASTLHTAFMNSTGHRANILSPDFNFAGVGFTHTDGSARYTTVVFMESHPFTDCVGNKFENSILAIWGAGITKGCNPPENTRFCPKSIVNRAQMAAFLSRALALPPASKDYFTDDNGAWYEASANALAQAGITKGCNPPNNDHYCGTQAVTRGQMAAFLSRALALPPASKDYFWDDNGTWYEDAANRMYEAKITYGCGSGKYCGGDVVPREQMAAFLARALGL